jgi:hypothetical protein
MLIEKLFTEDGPDNQESDRPFFPIFTVSMSTNILKQLFDFSGDVMKTFALAVAPALLPVTHDAQAETGARQLPQRTLISR